MFPKALSIMSGDNHNWKRKNPESERVKDSLGWASSLANSLIEKGLSEDA